ncbi:hypothetical protein C9890_0440 [Perkinsus sp. BL_2016]|nr:hypothetical protein C9890_0440 [Perkinsus sp. BL_2016]
MTRISAVIKGIIGSMIVLRASDPCAKVCESMPGACGFDGSRCMGQVCTDLFWKDNVKFCNSSMTGCPCGIPVRCDEADAVTSVEDHFGITVYKSEDRDFCSEVCDWIPGACLGTGSQCIGGEWCTDLFWYRPRVLCNPTLAKCDDMQLPRVSCTAARDVVSGTEDGVVALEDVEAEPRSPTSAVDEFAFAPGQRGRRGFVNFDSTSHFASALQLVTHSLIIRTSIMDELRLQISRADPNRNPVFQQLVALIGRMYEAGDEPLDLTELRSAMLESVDYRSIDNPMQVFQILLNEIAEASVSLAEAIMFETRREDFCSQCNYAESAGWTQQRAVQVVGFPTSTPTRTRWSIKDLLKVHLLGKETPERRAVCFGSCRRVTGHVERERIRFVPYLLTIAIDRRPRAAGGSTVEPVNSFVETPAEIDLDGILEEGSRWRYKLVGIVRAIGSRFLVDYFDSDTDEWIHANDTHLHVIQGQPRNGGARAGVVVFERLVRR